MGAHHGWALRKFLKSTSSRTLLIQIKTWLLNRLWRLWLPKYMFLITLNIQKVVAYQNLNIVRHGNWMFEWIAMGAFYTQVTTQNVKLTFWVVGRVWKGVLWCLALRWVGQKDNVNLTLCVATWVWTAPLNQTNMTNIRIPKSRESAQWNFKSLNNNIIFCLIPNIFWKVYVDFE